MNIGDRVSHRGRTGTVLALVRGTRARVLFPRVSDDPAYEQHVALEQLVPELRTVAALYVDPEGCYQGLEGVDLWDETRDARLYPGPHPVVAHPPCGVWCKLAKSVEGRYPHIKVGEDGGRFKQALLLVETHGGVLEHPAYSLAWSRYGLLPPNSDGWALPLPGLHSGAVCSVDQRRWGHRATKRTWLYACGIHPEDLPQLRWGRTPRADRGGPKPEAHVGHDSKRAAPLWGKRLGTSESSATPPAFALELVRIARLANRHR